MLRLALALTLALGLAGCGTLTATPGSPDQTVLAAGDIGAVGCAAFAIQGKPADVAMARTAVAQIKGVLASNNPTVGVISAVCIQAPDKYAALCSVVLQRIAIRLGNGVDFIPKDSVAFEALTAFVSTCSAALG